MNKAKQLLTEDGWTPGSDGIPVKDDQRFEFDLMTNSGNARRESLIAIVQQNLAEVGVKVNLKPLDFATLVDNHMGTGQFQAILLGWSLTPEPDAESTFSSAYFPPAGQNSGLYKNEKTDGLLRAAGSTPAARTNRSSVRRTNPGCVKWRLSTGQLVTSRWVNGIVASSLEPPA